MTRKPTSSIDDRGIIKESLEDLARPFVVPDRLLAADAKMASDREAGAEQWGGPGDYIIARTAARFAETPSHSATSFFGILHWERHWN